MTASIETAHLDPVKTTAPSNNGGNGVNDSNQYLDAPIKVKQDCLSCSGMPAQVLERFKMACLTYKPSKVRYR